MKQYNILCKEVTGVAGKILTSVGNPHNANEFAPGVIDELLKTKHIEEYKEVPVKKVEDPK